MKNLRSVLFALTVLLLATAAQAQQANVKANVPFDFVVGNQAYPAGEYELKSLTNNNIIRIEGAQESTANLVMSIGCASITPSEKTKLVFHRVGGNYFLYQVWVEGRLSGREFPMSSTEVQLAQNHEKPELVIVAANFSK